MATTPLRCTIGLHSWTFWEQRMLRRHVPIPGSEGMIGVTIRQERRCILCGLADRRVLPEQLGSPADGSLLKARERKDLRHRPLAEIEIDTYQPQPNAMLCTLGLHRWTQRGVGGPCDDAIDECVGFRDQTVCLRCGLIRAVTSPSTS